MKELTREEMDNILSYAEDEKNVLDPEILGALSAYSRLWVAEGGTSSPEAIWSAFVKSPVLFAVLCCTASVIND